MPYNYRSFARGISRGIFRGVNVAARNMPAAAALASRYKNRLRSGFSAFFGNRTASALRRAAPLAAPVLTALANRRNSNRSRIVSPSKKWSAYKKKVTAVKNKRVYRKKQGFRKMAFKTGIVEKGYMNHGVTASTNGKQLAFVAGTHFKNPTGDFQAVDPTSPVLQWNYYAPATVGMPIEMSICKPAFSWVFLVPPTPTTLSSGYQDPAQFLGDKFTVTRLTLMANLTLKDLANDTGTGTESLMQEPWFRICLFRVKNLPLPNEVNYTEASFNGLLTDMLCGSLPIVSDSANQPYENCTLSCHPSSQATHPRKDIEYEFATGTPETYDSTQAFKFSKVKYDVIIDKVFKFSVGSDEIHNKKVYLTAALDDEIDRSAFGRAGSGNYPTWYAWGFMQSIIAGRAADTSGTEVQNGFVLKGLKHHMSYVQ